MKIMIKEKYLQQIEKIIRHILSGHNDVKVYIFGSRARMDFHETSDIDIALLGKKILPNILLSRLREAFEESTIPYQIDVVDLLAVDESFRHVVLKEGKLWIELSNV